MFAPARLTFVFVLVFALMHLRVGCRWIASIFRARNCCRRRAIKWHGRLARFRKRTRLTIGTVKGEHSAQACRDAFTTKARQLADGAHFDAAQRFCDGRFDAQRLNGQRIEMA